MLNEYLWEKLLEFCVVQPLFNFTFNSQFEKKKNRKTHFVQFCQIIFLFYKKNVYH